MSEHRRYFRVVAAFVGIAVCAHPALSLAQTRQDLSRDAVEADSAPAEQQYIVTFADEATSIQDKTSIEQFVRSHGMQSDRLRHTFTTALKGFAVALDERELELMKRDPKIASIEPDVIVTAYPVIQPPKFPNFPFFPKKPKPTPPPRFPTPPPPSPTPPPPSPTPPPPSPTPPPPPPPSHSNQKVPTGVSRANGLLSPTAQIDGNDDRMDVDIAIIDTGISLNHPDLHVYRGVNFINGGSADDDNGHGTHVAGTAAAIDNDNGVVGVAPGARLWALKALNGQGSGTMSDIVEAVDYVAQHASEIEVANMSLGCECQSSALNQAINNAVSAGVTIVVAAGNSSKDSSRFSPASNPNVITVSAIADFNGKSGGGAPSTCRRDVDDTFADYSNYGSPVDIAAPGTCILSTWKSGGYNTISGTSMASPHVAGAAALLIAKNGRSSPSSVRSSLLGAASAQSSQDGFTGDPDGSREPLLNVQSL